MRHNKTRRGGSKTGKNTIALLPKEKNKSNSSKWKLFGSLLSAQKKENEKPLLSNGEKAFNPNNWEIFRPLVENNKTRRGGSKTGKKNTIALLSKGETYSNDTLLTRSQIMNEFVLRQQKKQKEHEKKTPAPVPVEPKNNTPDLLFFPTTSKYRFRSQTPPRPPRPSLAKTVSEPPPPRPRSKTRSKSKSKGNNAAAAAAARDYVEKQDRLLCGKHAFNNVVGAEVMTLEDIFQILKIKPEDQASYSGNIINEDLQKIINKMNKEPRYSAFPINSLSSYQGAIDHRDMPINTNISPFDDIINSEKGNLDIIFTAEIFKNARGQQMAITAPMKQFIRQLYLNFLMLLKYAPNFTGLIFQVNHTGFPTGHYIAIRKLDDGNLQMIDSIGQKKSNPLPFMSDYIEFYRENCARIIMSLFEKAGLTLRMGEPGINSTPLNILVVKPRELGKSHNGRFIG